MKKHTPKFLSFALAIAGASAACSAGEAAGPPSESAGGASGATDPLGSGGGVGTGSAPSASGDVIESDIFGAGSYSSTAPTAPCQVAQWWEYETALMMQTGSLIKKNGVVYEITGEGKGANSETTWADEWTEPPCSSPTNGHCADLAYEVVATCCDDEGAQWQPWELDATLDLTAGAVVVKDDVVYAVMGEGLAEETVATAAMAPPCADDNASCNALGYQELPQCE